MVVEGEGTEAIYEQATQEATSRREANIAEAKIAEERFDQEGDEARKLLHHETEETRNRAGGGSLGTTPTGE
jgi:hypothetical protein